MNFEVKRHELNTRTAEISKIQQRLTEVYQHTLEISEDLQNLRIENTQLKSDPLKCIDKKAEADAKVASATSDIESIRQKMG